MKGLLRSVEAIIAIMLLFVSLNSFFRIEMEEDAPLARYQRIVEDTLDVYSETYSFLIFNFPANIEKFTASVLPDFMNFRAEVQYVQPLDYFLAVNETNVPLTFYLDYPPGTDLDTLGVYDGRKALPFQTESNWFRVPFIISNDAVVRPDYEVTFSTTLAYQDTNSDGILEPVNPRSIQVFLEGDEVEFTSQISDFNVDSLDLALSFTTDLAASEIKNGYVYYLVGDVYEG